jgi:hypothetical protein
VIEELKAIIQAQEDSVRNQPYDGWDEDDDKTRELGDGEDIVSVFPNEDESVICTSWADDLRERLGDTAVALFGYEGEKNPTDVSKIADGHDFAIVNGRYFVDGWTVHIEHFHETGVMDIENDDDLDDVIRIYGDPRTWEPRENEKADPDNLIAERFAGRIDAYKANCVPSMI